MDELDEETNETHDQKPNGGGLGHLHELCAKTNAGQRVSASSRGVFFSENESAMNSIQHTCFKSKQVGSLTDP